MQLTHELPEIFEAFAEQRRNSFLAVREIKDTKTANRQSFDLHQADVQAQHLLDTLIPQMAKEAGVTEQLKMTYQLRWVSMMNVIKQQVEEIIWNEIAYK